MKRVMISAVMATGLVLGSLPVVAQTATEQQNQTTEQQQGEMRGHWRHHRGDQMERMAQKLNLSEQQKDQLKPILQQSREQAKATKDDTSLTQEQKREKLQTLRQQTRSQVNGVLTPAQQQQMAQLREERIAQRHEQVGKRMAEKLNLSQQQQDQLKPIFEKQREQAKAIWQDNSLTQDQKREKFQSLRQETRLQMNQVLTPEQQQQLQQMREQRKQRKHRHGGSGEPSPQAEQPQAS